MSILKRKKKEEGEDELEKILTQLKEEPDEKDVVVTIQIAGLKELVKAVEQLTDALKKCSE
ncbi:MAG: hypothetical protein QXK71_02285 [Pyrobaculum sp.]|jgi:thymidylate synthase